MLLFLPDRVYGRSCRIWNPPYEMTGPATSWIEASGSWNIVSSPEIGESRETIYVAKGMIAKEDTQPRGRWAGPSGGQSGSRLHTYPRQFAISSDIARARKARAVLLPWVPRCPFASPRVLMPKKDRRKNKETTPLSVLLPWDPWWCAGGPTFTSAPETPALCCVAGWGYVVVGNSGRKYNR